jgi:hypothetical protein
MKVQTKFSSLALCLALSPIAHAITGCSNSWPLQGSYAMQFHGATASSVTNGVGGVILPANFTGGQAVGYAQFTLDGMGVVAGVSHVNLNGAWSDGTITGAYAVNLDCTMSLSLVDSSGDTQSFTGAIVGQGRGAVLIQTDAGTGVSATLQSTRSWCTATPELAGTFGFSTTGSTLGTNGAAYSSVGLLSLDGQGNASATESRFTSGASTQVTSTGSITVNADCSVAIALTSTGAPATTMNFRGYMVSDTSQIVLIQSDADTAVRGTVVVQ